MAGFDQYSLFPPEGQEFKATPEYRKYLGPRICQGKVTLDVDLLEVVNDEILIVLFEEKHLTVKSNTYTSLIPIEVDDRVYHKLYGFVGSVLEIDGFKMTVEWDNGGRSVVELTDVERAE